MDWEKRTVQRAALSQAAADTFNNQHTPSQSLLKSLQAAEVVRKDHYAATVGAKMKQAKEKLSSTEAKHAIKSDMAIFGQPPAEVHGLLPDANPKQAGMVGIKAMQISKAERHEAAWQQYMAMKDLAVQTLEQTAGGLVSQLKAQLSQSDAEIDFDMSVLAEDRVMVLDESQIYQVQQLSFDVLLAMDTVMLLPILFS